MKSFKDYWKKPFYSDELGIFVHDSNGKKICDFLVNDGIVKEAILNILNEKSKPEDDVAIVRVREQALLHGCDVAGDVVTVGETAILRVRGWGYLTGRGYGGLGLGNEEAVEIQNDFLKFIKDSLKGE